MRDDPANLNILRLLKSIANSFNDRAMQKGTFAEILRINIEMQL
jgi:hypothetical protein